MMGNAPSEDLGLQPVAGNERPVAEREQVAQVCATPEQVSCHSSHSELSK